MSNARAEQWNKELELVVLDLVPSLGAAVWYWDSLPDPDQMTRPPSLAPAPSENLLVLCP